MINEAMYARGAESSKIREIFTYACERKAQIGADKVFDFSLGNPSIPAPEAVRSSIERSLAECAPEELHGYTPAPGLPAARKAVAASLNRRFGTSYSMGDIFMTVGAAASVSCALHALTSPGDEVIVVSPYFPEYKVWIESCGCTCVEAPAKPYTFRLSVGSIMEAITPRTAAIIVNSPNNPTGNAFPDREIEELLRRFDGVVVLDEAYIDFAEGRGFLPRLDEFPNLIVLQTLSTAWGMAGLRLGLAFASERIAALFGQVKYPYNINTLTQQTAAECLRRNIAAQVAQIREERGRLAAALAGCGCIERVYPSQANFLLVKTADPDRLYGELIAAGVIVRNRTRIAGCEGCLRITVGTPAENRRMLETVKDFRP